MISGYDLQYSPKGPKCIHMEPGGFRHSGIWSWLGIHTFCLCTWALRVIPVQFFVATGAGVPGVVCGLG